MHKEFVVSYNVIEIPFHVHTIHVHMIAMNRHREACSSSDMDVVFALVQGLACEIESVSGPT